MNCIKCNKEIPPDALYCCYCGTMQAPQERNTKKRGNGTGSVYKSPSGSWTAEVTLGYYIEGDKHKRKHRRKSGFKTKKAAVAYLNTLFCAPVENKAITLSELYEAFKIDLQALSASKRTAYNIAWRKIKSEVEFRTIDSFTVSELQELTDNAAPSYYTRRDIKQLLSHLYKIAIRDDYTEKNRAEFIKLPKLETSERDTFTPQDIKTLWADYEKEPEKVTACMLVMLYTGIRAGELLTIKTQNINISAQYMTGGIKTTKGKNRKIIIPDKLIPVINFLCDRSERGLLAYYPKDNDFYNLWKQKRASLCLRETLTPYCCRHTYITMLTALKVSPAMLQELAGHEDYDTTLEYTHLSIADRLAEVNRLL